MHTSQKVSAIHSGHVTVPGQHTHSSDPCACNPKSDVFPGEHISAPASKACVLVYSMQVLVYSMQVGLLAGSVHAADTPQGGPSEAGRDVPALHRLPEVRLCQERR